MDGLARILYDVWMDEMVRKQLIQEVPWWNAHPTVKAIWHEVAARARWEVAHMYENEYNRILESLSHGIDKEKEEGDGKE